MVKLDKMTPVEYQAYQPSLTEGYAEALARNLDMTMEEARERSRQQTGELLAQGVDTPDHRLYTVRKDGSQDGAGALWVYVDKGKGSAFIYDITIAESMRGQGLGKAVLLLLEDTLRPEGIKKIQLHVFGDNPVALHLYESLGYETTSRQMRKMLTEKVG